MSRNVRLLTPYAAALVGCVLALVVLLRGSAFDFTVPLRYQDDALMTHLWVKTIGETGWYLTNPRLGAPASMDFSADNLHFFLIKLLCLVHSDWKVVGNLYFLITYPLTTLTAVYALRRCGISGAMAVVAGLLYAFLPYHAMRNQGHLMLAAYYLVPLSVLVVLRVYFGPSRTGLSEQLPDRRGRWGSLCVCLLQSSAGVYYAFFACFFFLLAGGAASLRQRGFRPLGAAGIWIAVTVLGLLANLTPNLVHWVRHGRNHDLAQRYAMHAELFNLRITQLVMPTPGHIVPPLNSIRSKYDSRINATFESQTVALGMIGSVGFLLLLGRLAWLGSGRGRPHLLDALSLLNVAALLLATSGGLGVIFNMLVMPHIRCYARIVVYISFFSLMAVAWGLDWLAALWVRGAATRIGYALVLGLLLIGGVIDQTPRLSVPSHGKLGDCRDDTRRRFQQDAEFVAKIESSLVPGAMIYQLPYIVYPEACQLERMGAYEHLCLYLHSRALRISFGGMRGRPGDLWQRELAQLPVERQLETMVLSGFAGVQIDRRGYSDDAHTLELDLRRLLAVKPIASADGQRLFFSLEHYSRAYREGCGEDEWQRRQELALRPLGEKSHR